MKTKTITKRTGYFKAYSDPRQTNYKTERARTGEVFCTCPGYLYRRTCRHSERAKTWK